jgi:hypothetical protein
MKDKYKVVLAPSQTSQALQKNAEFPQGAIFCGKV